jgi:[NiFe] hydrogenase assembly HybE family chaperone
VIGALGADALAGRVQALTRTFQAIGATRMIGLPVVHPALHVEAVGFRLLPADGGSTTGLGVLITPWFMSLVRVPVERHPDRTRVGASREYDVGEHRIAFIAAFEEDLGAFETCPLFSPLFAFPDHTAVRATADEVLRGLFAERAPRVDLPSGAGQGRVESGSPTALGRRGFLFGRLRGEPG